MRLEQRPLYWSETCGTPREGRVAKGRRWAKFGRNYAGALRQQIAFAELADDDMEFDVLAGDFAFVDDLELAAAGIDDEVNIVTFVLSLRAICSSPYMLVTVPVSFSPATLNTIVVSSSPLGEARLPFHLPSMSRAKAADARAISRNRAAETVFLVIAGWVQYLKVGRGMQIPRTVATMQRAPICEAKTFVKPIAGC